MKILGVDPGTRFVGYAVLEKEKNRIIPRDFGLVNASKIKLFPDRLLYIYECLEVVIQRNQVDSLAMEEVFLGKNVKSAIKIGEARGVIFLCGAKNNLPVYEYAPTVVKKAVTGNGRAHKSQVAQMVIRMLHLPPDPLKEDTTDALAIALCHCHRIGHEGF